MSQRIRAELIKPGGPLQQQDDSRCGPGLPAVVCGAPKGTTGGRSRSQRSGSEQGGESRWEVEALQTSSTLWLNIDCFHFPLDSVCKIQIIKSSLEFPLWRSRNESD